MKKKLLPLTFLAFLNLLNVYCSEAQTTPCELAIKQQSKSVGSGAVNNPKRAVDDDLFSYSSLTVIPGHAGDVAAQTLRFPSSGSAGDSIYVKLSFPFSVTQVATLSNISLATFNGNSFNNDRVSLNSSSVILSWHTSNEAIAKIKASKSFDRLEIEIKSGGNGKASSVKVFYANTVVQRPTLNVSQVEICAGHSVTLKALGPQNATFKWYTTSVSGSSLHSGASFNTPTLFSDVVYYVESSRNGCANRLRTPVFVKIIQPQPAVKQWDKTYGAPSTSEWLNGMIAAPGGKYHIWYVQNISYPTYKHVHGIEFENFDYKLKVNR